MSAVKQLREAKPDLGDRLIEYAQGELEADAEREAIQAESAAAEAAPRESGYILSPVDDLLVPGPPVAYRVDNFIEDGATVGVVGAPEAGKSLLFQNVAASVATDRPFHGRAVRPGLVVYLVGEGQHGLRPRFQALELRQFALAGAPLVISKVAASLLDPVEVLRVHQAIDAAQERYSKPLSLLIVDTLARFIAPGDESKSQDMSRYLEGIDSLRGAATAISLHHPGHLDATRARGSSSFRAGLDAEFSVTNDAGVITVACSKMKDGPRPAPFSFRIETAPTRLARPDGSPIHSVVLVPTEAKPARPQATGKNQKRLLEALETQDKDGTVWTEEELRSIARGLGMHRNSARDAVLGLRQLGYLSGTVGGSRLTHQVAP